MLTRSYCPKAEGHGVDTCKECQFYCDDCDGDEDEFPNTQEACEFIKGCEKLARKVEGRW